MRTPASGLPDSSLTCPKTARAAELLSDRGGASAQAKHTPANANSTPEKPTDFIDWCQRHSGHNSDLREGQISGVATPKRDAARRAMPCILIAVPNPLVLETNVAHLIGE